ncbi:MAG: hypothetical protein ACAI25_02620, partial [Planctomycetota bacterium]
AVEATPVGAELAKPSREELMLRALWQMLEKQQAQIAEIRDLAASAHMERTRAEKPAPPRLTLGRPRPPLAERLARAPRRAKLPSAVGVVVVFFAAFSLGAGWLAAQTVQSERARSERALEQADWMARRLVDERRGTAPVASSATLPAGFRR